MNDIQRVVFDAIKAEDAKTKKDYNQALREKILDVMGMETWDYYAFMDNQYKIFAIIRDMFPVMTKAGLQNKFDRWVDFHDVAVGDKPYFTVEDNNIYATVTTSRGNADVDRQAIKDRKFSVTTANESIKFYDELDRFMTGEITIERMTMKALDAHLNSTALKISDAIYNSYSSVGTNYKATGAFDSSTLNSIIEHVKASTGASKVQIFGTSTALSNVDDIAGRSDAEIEQFNGMGFYGYFRGHELIALPQAYRPNTSSQTFAVNTNYLVIVPADTKIGKVVFEGDVFIKSTDSTDRNDKQLEIMYDRRMGVAAITVAEGQYGIYKFA